MGDFVFKDIIRSKNGEYLLQTANSVYQHRIVSSFFKNGSLIDSKQKEYDENIGDDALLSITRSFHEEAKEEVQALLQMVEKLADSEHAETKNLLGLAFFRKGMYDEAINQFEDAIVISPDNSVIYDNLGRAYLSTGKVDEAIAVLERAIELSPNFADFHNDLGLAYLEKQQCKKAVEQFEKAIDINAYYADAYYNLAIAYILNAHSREDFSLSVNIYSKVMENIEKAARINPNLNNEYSQKGRDFLRSENYENAIAAFEKAKSAQASSPDTSFILDFYLQVIADGTAMKSSTIWRHIRQLEELVKKYPNYADLYNDLGVAYVVMSKHVNGKAIEYFKKSMELNPNFERAKKNKRLAEYDSKGMQLLFDAILKKPRN